MGHPRNDSTLTNTFIQVPVLMSMINRAILTISFIDECNCKIMNNFFDEVGFYVTVSDIFF